MHLRSLLVFLCAPPVTLSARGALTVARWDLDALGEFASPSLAMRATPEQTRLLAQIPAFASLTPQERDGLLMFARERRLAPAAVLFDEGAQGDSLFIVLEGELSVMVRAWSTSGASRRELSRVKVGEMLGEMACLDPAPRSATVVAREASVLAELDRSGLAAMEQNLPRVSAQLVGSVIQLVHTRMREVDQRIAATLSGASSQPPPVTPSTPPSATPETRDEPEKRGGWRGLIARVRGSV